MLIHQFKMANGRFWTHFVKNQFLPLGGQWLERHDDDDADADDDDDCDYDDYDGDDDHDYYYVPQSIPE